MGFTAQLLQRPEKRVIGYMLNVCLITLIYYRMLKRKAGHNSNTCILKAYRMFIKRRISLVLLSDVVKVV